MGTTQEKALKTTLGSENLIPNQRTNKSNLKSSKFFISETKIKLFFILGLGILVTTPSWAIDLLPFVKNDNSLNHLQKAYEEVKEDPSVRKMINHAKENVIIPVQSISGPLHTHTIKFQHYYKGIEVIGSLAFHHDGNQGDTIVDNRLAEFDLDTHPKLSSEEAIAIAKSAAGDLQPKDLPTLEILPSPSQNSARLVYWVTLNSSANAAGRDVLIDAHSGKLIANLSRNYSMAPIQVYTAKNQGLEIIPHLIEDSLTREGIIDECQVLELGSGQSSVITKNICIGYYLGNLGNMRNQCQVIDGMSGVPLSIRVNECKQVVKDSKSMLTIDFSVQNALKNSLKVLDYYQRNFNRNSYDDRGSDLVSIVHGGEKMANAFWASDLHLMVYGDGDQRIMRDFTSAIDIAGHEMTHGITSETANLLMMSESGALNEAFSDFFGKMIEGKGDWIMGREIFLASSQKKGLRNLKDPGSFLSGVLDANGKVVMRPYPSKKSQAAKVGPEDYCDDRNDNCWVHLNSTIPGHAFYLISEALGKQKGAQILYTALTQNLSSNDNFKLASRGILEAGKLLGYSDEEIQKVKEILIKVEML